MCEPKNISILDEADELRTRRKEEGYVQCDQKSCLNQATLRFFWPGRPPTSSCASCAAQAQGLAGAMGFELHVEPL